MNIDEGLFFADKKTKKIQGRTADEVKQKIDAEIKADDGKYKMKQVGGIKMIDTGRFVGQIQFQINDKDSRETLGSKIGGAVKDVVQKYKELPKETMEYYPSQRAANKALKQKMQDDPNYKGKVELNPNQADPKKAWRLGGYGKIQPKQTPSGDRISNIQKQLAKLSDDKLQKIQDIINT